MKKPDLCILGLMWDEKKEFMGHSCTLANLFEKERYSVRKATTRRNAFARLFDLVKTVWASKGKSDLIIFDIFGGRSFIIEDLVSLVAKWVGQPLVLVLHGGDLPKFMQKYPQWTTRVLKRSTATVTPSAFLSRSIQSFNLKAEVIPNVITLDDYPFRHRTSLKPKLFWMRTFHPVYNPELALRSLRLLKPKFPEIELVMGGAVRGSHLNAIQKLTVEWGLQKNVNFVGFLNREGKIREASQADIFLNTNRIDNMPLSVVEACAFGLPVVSTAVGGIPDLLTHEKNALLVSDDSPEEMAEAIERLLLDSDLASRISENARQVAERSDWFQVKERWGHLFHRILDNQCVA